MKGYWERWDFWNRIMPADALWAVLGLVLVIGGLRLAWVAIEEASVLIQWLAR